MEIVTARNFRANQTRILKKAQQGEAILLSSRIGMFRISPISEEESLTSKICKGLEEVKLIQEGKVKGYSVEDVLSQL